MFYRLTCLLVLVATLATSQTNSYNWPCFRGPDRNSITQETAWSHESLKSPNILWQKEIGDGFAVVAIQDGYLYTVGNQRRTDTIYCLEATTGKEIWKYSYPCSPGPYPGSRATPLVENGVVYSLSRQGHVFCLDARTGQVKWQKKFDAEEPEWGFASSPSISGNKLLLNIGEHGIALDKTNGNTIWQSNFNVQAGYATIVTFQNNSKEVAAVFSGKAIYLVDANTGKKLWSHPWTTSYGVNAADPIIHDNKMFISSGYGYGCAFVNLAGTAPQIIGSRVEIMRNHFGTCVLLDGYLYGIDGQSMGGPAWLKCLDFKTGEEKWSEKIGFAALMASKDGRLIIGTATGDLIIAKANPNKYEQLGRGSLAKMQRGQVCWNMPVLCNGLVYIRTSGGKLVCADLRK